MLSRVLGVSVPVARCRTSSILYGRLGAEIPPSLCGHGLGGHLCSSLLFRLSPVFVLGWKGLYLGAWHVNVTESKAFPCESYPWAEHRSARNIPGVPRAERSEAPFWIGLRCVFCAAGKIFALHLVSFPAPGQLRTRSKPVHATGLCINGIEASSAPASSTVSWGPLRLNGAPGSHPLQPGVVEV